MKTFRLFAGALVGFSFWMFLGHLAKGPVLSNGSSLEQQAAIFGALLGIISLGAEWVLEDIRRRFPKEKKRPFLFAILGWFLFFTLLLKRKAKRAKDGEATWMDTVADDASQHHQATAAGFVLGLLTALYVFLRYTRLRSTGPKSDPAPESAPAE